MNKNLKLISELVIETENAYERAKDKWESSYRDLTVFRRKYLEIFYRQKNNFDLESYIFSKYIEFSNSETNEYSKIRAYINGGVYVKKFMKGRYIVYMNLYDKFPLEVYGNKKEANAIANHINTLVGYNKKTNKDKNSCCITNYDNSSSIEYDSMLIDNEIDDIEDMSKLI